MTEDQEKDVLRSHGVAFPGDDTETIARAILKRYGIVATARRAEEREAGPPKLVVHQPEPVDPDIEKARRDIALYFERARQ